MRLLLRCLRLALLCYAGYVALVILVLMPLGNALLPRVVLEQTGRELRLDLLTLNPFNLEASLHRAALLEPEGGDFLRVDRLVVNASLLHSLLQRHPVLDALAVHRLQLHLKREAATGRFNFDDILAHRQALAEAAPPEVAPDQDEAPPALTIRRLALSADRLTYREQRPGQEDYSTSIDDLALVLDHFSTVQEEGQPYRLAATTEQEGLVYWQGGLSTATAHSQGRLRFQGLHLAPLYRYLADRLGLVLHSAQLDADLHYRIDWGGPELQLSLDERSHVALAQLELSAVDDAETRLALNRLDLAGLRLDLSRRTLALAGIDLSGLEVHGHSQGADTSLEAMLALELGEEEDDDGDDLPWRIEVDRLGVSDGRILWQAAELAVPLNVAARLTVVELNWPAIEQPATLQLDSRINERASLQLTGNLQPDGSLLRLSGELEQLPLQWLNPLLEQFIQGRIEGGAVSSQWQLQLDADRQLLSLPRGAVGPLSLRTTTADQTELLAWQALNWQQVQLDPGRQRAEIHRLELDHPQGRLAIAADGSTNFHDLVKAPVDSGEGPAVEEESGADEAWQLALGQLQIREGTLDFSDASLALPFRVTIQQFHGEVADLDSRADQPARVELEGRVDGYSPVSLTGTLQPLASPPELALDFNFSGLELTTLTPYSGTYAGYALRRGQLDVGLSYTLEQGRIAGDNRIVINQLELGERIASPRVIDLPLRLAIALLKDSRGVIDLGVQVRGDLDDPEFDLSQVIWAAFRNLIVKAVTAPFRLLASLVGSDRELDYLGFQQGGLELDDEADKIMAEVSSALHQRPALRLSLSGHAHVSDQDSLARQHLENALLEAGLTPGALAERGRSWEQALAAHYRQLHEGFDEALPAEALEAALLAHHQPDPAELEELAHRRALQIKQALTAEYGLEPERVFLQRPDSVLGPRPGVELDVAP